jgi:ABC-2 type transport system ATP-binding protein
VIELNNVSKRYGARTVIENLSFTVDAGEILGFLGPNGAGKTTTIRMIAGVTTATSGIVTVAGYDMAHERLAAARHLGYLPERPPIYDTLTVRQYLRFVAKAKAIGKSAIETELERVMDACRLLHMAAREIYKLSKGYRQRLGLAQALIGSPDVLLLDEPTIGLDPAQMQETREVIRRASEGHAVLLSTHILAEVTLICPKVAIINNGQLLAMDTPEGLERNLARSGLVRLRAAGDARAIERALADIDGVIGADVSPAPDDHTMLSIDCLVDDHDGVEAQIARVISRSFDLYALERQRPTLENVFLHYIGGDAFRSRSE